MNREEFMKKWSELEKGSEYSPTSMRVYIGNDGNLIYANAYEFVQGSVQFFEDDEYRTEDYRVNIGEFRLEDIRDIELRWE